MNASMRSVLPAWVMGEVDDHAISLPLDLVKMSCPSSVPVKAICTAAEALSSIALGSVCRAFSGCTICLMEVVGDEVHVCVAVEGDIAACAVGGQAPDAQDAGFVLSLRVRVMTASGSVSPQASRSSAG